MYVEQFIQQYAKIEILKMRKMGLLEGGPTTEGQENSRGSKMGFRMQDIKKDMLDRMGDVQVYDSINTRNQHKNSRDVSRGSIPATGQDTSKQGTPLKRAKSTLGSSMISKKRSSLAAGTDPKKNEVASRLNISKVKQDSEPASANDGKSPLRG